MEEELEEQNKDIWIKSFISVSSFKQCRDYYYKPRFNGIFARNNLPRIKDRAYVINLDDKNSKVTQWVSLFIDKNTAVYLI